MYPHPQGNRGTNNEMPPPVNGDAPNSTEHPAAQGGEGHNDVFMTDAVFPTSPPMPATNNEYGHVMHQKQHESVQDGPDDAAFSFQSQQLPQFQAQQPTQPPLGRNASAGDTQLRLGERQDSIGVRQPFSGFAHGFAHAYVAPPSQAAPPLKTTTVDASTDDTPFKMEEDDFQDADKPPVAANHPSTITPSVRQTGEKSQLTPPSSFAAENVGWPINSNTSLAVAAEPTFAEDEFAHRMETQTAPPHHDTKSSKESSEENQAADSLQLSENAVAEEGTATAHSVDNGNNLDSRYRAEESPVSKLSDGSSDVSKDEESVGSDDAAPSNGVTNENEKTSAAGPMGDSIARYVKQGSTPQEFSMNQSLAVAPAAAAQTFASPAHMNAETNIGGAPPPPLLQAMQPVITASHVDAPVLTPSNLSPTVPAVAPPIPPNLLPNQNHAVPFPGAPPGAFPNNINAAAAHMDNGNFQQHPGPFPGAPPSQPAGGGPFGGMKELRVEDALLYLDDVKREFGDRPRIYNEFLAIMKNFKSQEVDTPGVIARVSKLFRGYNNLILGFNKFLPDGFKISMEDLKQQDAAYEREQEILRQQQAAMEAKAQQLQMQRDQQQVGGAPMIGTVGLGPPGSHGLLQQSSPQGVVPPGEQLHLQQQEEEEAARQQPLKQAKQVPPKLPKQAKQNTVKAAKGRKAQPASTLQVQQPQPVEHQAVEFDHAISYVTTIKRRFANDPGTYHAFLEILHTYQKEQRGIKEVLEQVAHLFQDHPDLLKQFTFFLPDAVQEQAKERLHKAAAESESRLSALRAKKQQNTMEIDQGASGASQQVIDMTGQPMLIDSDARSRKRSFKDAHDAPTPIAFPQTPEAYVYNSAVERQFFDAAKEALASYTRDGGQAWAEFMKCLDMYAQEILSRNEMLNFVEPLLGKRNNKLFEEFKRILSAAGGHGTNTAQPVEDSWYSVPLSEIDFSRCRRCSPSYRALPRDYPAPPCSERSDKETKVLNDVWVSLPVGSEESYTFRHMRRNTYEETLFRCEDERFEIDMAIDSNLCTLALLEPFAEEMAMLSVNELQTRVEQDNEPKPALEQKGLGGKFFQYSFDSSILGVVHRNSITRIYGEQGAEMLELLKNNPSVAIPIVVKRLRQKDEEWRRVRDRLNRHWKELAEQNYYKSLDHRSLTWRTTDKRAISTRTLISEIKDRAANNGNEGQTALQARIDKAKEEHGSFYEVTMAKSIRWKLDLANLPKPERRLFTPHMSLLYENNAWVQRDAYRIMSFALERGSISPTDKERCHRLWTEFLGPWFKLSLNWMLSPAVNFQESSSLNVGLKDIARIVTQDESSPIEDEEESLYGDGELGSRIITEHMHDHRLDDAEETPNYVDHHPLPAGSTVSTIYGEGRVLRCRKEDGIYEVELPLGNAFLRPSAVLCSILAAEKSAYTTQRRHVDRTKLDRLDDKLVIGTQSLYLFFRLHQILCRRLGIAKRLAYEVKSDSSLQTLVEQMPGNDDAASGRRRYDAFLSLVFALLDGGTGSVAEGGKYEDRVRSLLGHGGYELATMDKLISHILKNVQSMANDDTMWSLVQLFRRHADAGGCKPEALRQEAAYLSDGEQMYAFQLCPVHKDAGENSVLYIEYLGVLAGSEEDGSLSDPAVEHVTKRQKR